MGTRDRLIAQLEAHFSPNFLEVRDESSLHAGHVGAGGQEGETHFRIRIQSALLTGQNRVQQHQAIYGVVGMAAHNIHALAIEVLLKDPTEAES